MILIYECPVCSRQAHKTCYDVLICCAERMVLVATYESLEEYRRVRGYVVGFV